MNNKDEMFDYLSVKSYFSQIISLKTDEIIIEFVKAGDDWMNGRAQDDDITFVIIHN